MASSSWIEEEWSALRWHLPEGWREKAWESKAMERSRKIADPETLLRLILMHAGGGLSLQQTAGRARAVGLSDVSDVALLKRFRKCGQWVQWMNQQLAGLSIGKDGELVKGRRLLALDGSDVSEPGATGSDWRLHYCVELASLSCHWMKITDVSQAESAAQVPLDPRDIVLIDRGYCRASSLGAVLETGADVVVRYHSTSLPLFEADGSRVDVWGWIKTLKGSKPMERTAYFHWKDRVYPLRICVLRKALAQARRARQKAIRKASKDGHRIRPQTLALSEYVIVLCSLPEATLNLTQTLELYRARWQVELVFKRLKSLLCFGHLPKYDPDSSKAWLQAKLLVAQLAERILLYSRTFSPWGYPLESLD
jgi:hypothetical protein